MKVLQTLKQVRTPVPANGAGIGSQADSAAKPKPKPEQVPTEALPEISPKRGQEQMLGAVPRLQVEQFERGKRRALESGALIESEADVRALVDLATAAARETHRDLYNPAKYAHDQLLNGEYQKHLRDRDEAELAVKYALVAVRDYEHEAAAAFPGDAPKPASWAVAIAAVIAMMITVAPTLHDFVFVMADEFSSWFLSVLSGLFLGLLITLMILGDAESSEQRTATNWVGLSAGLFVSVALGGLRIKGAENPGDYIFAAAMTALELGIVIGLEGIATSRRKVKQAWAVRKIAADCAEAKLDMATLHLERCTQRLEAINQAIGAHINYVEERCFRFQRIDEIIAAAVQAVRDGYRAGIAANRGQYLRPEGRQR